MAQPYAAAGIEPPLEELLSDPITLLLMQRDGIGLADVWRAVAAGRARLQAGMWDPEQERRSLPACEPSPELGTDRPAPGERPLRPPSGAPDHHHPQPSGGA